MSAESISSSDNVDLSTTGTESLLVTTPTLTEDEQELSALARTQNRDLGKNFNKMMSELGDDYFNYVVKLARQQEYTLTLKKPTGRKTTDPVTDEEVDEYIGWEQKTYKRNKITTEEYNKVETLRALYNKEKDAEKIAKILGKMYRYLAYIYLGMTEADFKRADWEEIKPTLDSCNFGTVYSMRQNNKA